MPAGDYNCRLLWLIGTRTQDNLTGENILTHGENGYLWGAVEPTNGRRGTDFGATITGADVEIRLRNYPDITVDDLLRDGYGTTYRIESLYEGDNELILQCYYNDSLTDFIEEGS